MKFFRKLSRYSTALQFRQMTLLSLFCMLLLVLISSILYINIILNRNRTYINRIIEQCHSSIEQRTSEALQFVQTIAYDDAVSQYLLEDDPYKSYELSRQVTSFLSSIKAIQPQIVEAYLFRNSDAPQSFLSLAPHQEQILSQISGARTPVVIGFYPYQTTTTQRMMLYLGCSIYNTDSPAATKHPLGGVAVAMNLDYLADDLNELSQIPGLHYAILSSDMTLVCGSTDDLDAALLNQASGLLTAHESGVIGGRLQEVSVTPILDTQGSLLVYTNHLIVLQDMLNATTLILLCTTGMYLLISYVFHIIRSSVALPIERLTNALNNDASRPFPVEGNKDIQTLTTTLNDLFARENQLTQNLLDANTRLYEAKLVQNQLELQFLRSQINPHFIYNTLEVIRSISVIRQNSEVAKMATSLATILRYSIKGDDSVPLRDELNIIRCYLSIQTTRFGNRFEHRFDIDPEVEKFLIPRMCLQPLVENAISHGLEQKLDHGHLLIRAFTADNELNIVIQDDGVGLPVEVAQLLNHRIKQPVVNLSSVTHGIGLVNVARRIQIARGNEFGMEIKSAPDCGMTVTLKLPILKEA